MVLMLVPVLPFASVTVKVTDLSPAVVYLCVCGVTWLVIMGVPSPKFHVHWIIAAEPTDDLSVKVIVSLIEGDDGL